MFIITPVSIIIYLRPCCRDLPGQAEALIAKMQRDSEIDFANDWKMVTLFIGGNNLCAYCEDLVSLNPCVYCEDLVSLNLHTYSHLSLVRRNLKKQLIVITVTNLG